MSYKLRISAQAQNDIESIYNYVVKYGISIAKKQADLIYSSLENLQIFPKMGANLSTYTTQKNDYKFLSIKRRTLYFTESFANASSLFYTVKFFTIK